LLDLLLRLIGGGVAADGDDSPEMLSADVQEHDGSEEVDAGLVAVDVRLVLDTCPALILHRGHEA